MLTFWFRCFFQANAPTTASATQSEDGDDLNEAYKGEVTVLGEEDSLLRQSFMLNPSVTVHDFCQSSGVEILDFVRMEVGDWNKTDD